MIKHPESREPKFQKILILGGAGRSTKVELNTLNRGFFL
jgi:hypothetical protein